MRRRMLIVLLLTMVATSSTVSGQALTTCGWASCVYLPAMLDQHIIPPPPISDAVMQRTDLGDQWYLYTVETFREVPNSEAAKTYKNPAQTLKDFAVQGRETSWLAQYSNARASAHFVVTGDQVYRYTTADGAIQGQAYTVAGHRHSHPDFVPFTLPFFDGFGAPTVQLMRQQDINGVTYSQYLISVQIGRYVTEMQMIGQSSSSWAIQTSIPAVDRLKAFPQN